MLRILAIVLLTGLTACVHSDETARLQSRGAKVAAVSKPAVASSVRAPAAARVTSASAQRTCKGIECKRVGMLLGVSY